MKPVPLWFALIALTATPEIASSQDAGAAAERARLADQRIKAEAATRAEEARESLPEASPGRQDDVAATPADRQASGDSGDVTQSSPARPAVAAPAAVRSDLPPTRPAGSSSGIDASLRQLRALGELRDAGYLTDDEFERIKRRIIDDRF